MNKIEFVNFVNLYKQKEDAKTNFKFAEKQLEAELRDERQRVEKKLIASGDLSKYSITLLFFFIGVIVSFLFIILSFMKVIGNELIQSYAPHTLLPLIAFIVVAIAIMFKRDGKIKEETKKELKKQGFSDYDIEIMKKYII